jgi:hypothetical protein
MMIGIGRAIQSKSVMGPITATQIAGSQSFTRLFPMNLRLTVTTGISAGPALVRRIFSGF